MDLTPQGLRAALQEIEGSGWEGAAAVELLEDLRRCVVLPVVRRTSLRGPAADQAVASGWAAAWDALRRPSAQTAQNPGGMVWAAVRRAVWAEVEASRGTRSGGQWDTDLAQVRQRCSERGVPGSGEARVESSGSTGQADVSLDWLMEAGWQPEGRSARDAAWSSPVLSRLVGDLVAVGWDPNDATDAIALMADHACVQPGGRAATQWRSAAARIGIPQWRARRLATLLLGDGATAGVVELVVSSGSGILGDPDVQEALQATTRRWAAAPTTWLARVQPLDSCAAGA